MNAKRRTRITKHDLRRLELAIANWRIEGTRSRKEGDAEMAKHYAMDVEDLEFFRDSIVRGELETARDSADRMDTLVRDQIPLQLYHKLFPER